MKDRKICRVLLIKKYQIMLYFIRHFICDDILEMTHSSHQFSEI